VELPLRLSEMVGFRGGKGGLLCCWYRAVGLEEREATASTVWVVDGQLDDEEEVFGRRGASYCFYTLDTVGTERVEAHAVFFLYEVF